MDDSHTFYNECSTQKEEEKSWFKVEHIEFQIITKGKVLFVVGIIKCIHKGSHDMLFT